MFDLRGVAFWIVLAALPHAAHAQEVEPVSFAELEKTVDPADRDAVVGARAALENADTKFWHELRPPGPFRTALARSYTPDEVRGRLDAAAGDADALATTVRNLASRRDLGALLAEDRRFETLVDEHLGLLRDVAVDDLWERRRPLGIALLDSVGVSESMAGSLMTCRAPDAARLVADVVSGKVTITPQAMAELARANQLSYSPRRFNTLGADRIEALLAVARTSADHRLRLAAGCVLQHASDAGSASVKAWASVRSSQERRDSWFLLARHAPSPVPMEDVPEFAVLSALRGEMAYGYVSAEQNFADADEAAARLAAAYDSVRDPRTRAGLLTQFEIFHDKLIVEELRTHAVPAWRAFLETLRTPQDTDPPLVRALSVRVATQLLAEIDDEPIPRSGHWARSAPLPPSKRAAAPKDWVAALVAAADDPATLLDLAEFESSKVPDELGRAPDDAERAPLRELVESCPDSRVARLAAKLLERTGRLDDLLFVLRRADRLALDDEGHRYWLPDFYTVSDLRERQTTEAEWLEVLALVHESELSPAARSAIMSNTLPWLWDADDESKTGAGQRARLLRWFEENAPNLDCGLAEDALETAIDMLWDWEADELDVPPEAWARLRAAVERVSTSGPRLRLLRSLDALD